MLRTSVRRCPDSLASPTTACCTSARVYREPAVRSPSETPPRELLYTPTDPDRVRGALPLMQLGAVPLFVGAVLSAFATPQVAAAGMVASAGLGVWWWRRSPGTAVLLRVEGGELIVSKQKPKREMGRFRLGELSDVELDTKTIRRVMDGASPIPAVRFTDSRVGPEVDTARIVLVR